MERVQYSVKAGPHRRGENGTPNGPKGSLTRCVGTAAMGGARGGGRRTVELVPRSVESCPTVGFSLKGPPRRGATLSGQSMVRTGLSGVWGNKTPARVQGCLLQPLCVFRVFPKNRVFRSKKMVLLPSVVACRGHRISILTK